ncbi:MAG TPA: hypothetical protein VIJ88_01545 [Candidatus Paceibacterota bacterium]
MKKNQVIGVIIALLIVGGGAFYGGMSYAGSQTPARVSGAAGFAGRTGAGGFAGRAGAAGGGFTAGQIVSTGSGSISIQQQNGSSTEIVLLSPTTQILKSTAGTASDLSQGTTVTVTGTSNSDGSLTATSIQIRPAGTGAGRTATPTSGQ